MKYKPVLLLFFIIVSLSCEDVPPKAEDKSGFVRINDTRHYFDFNGSGDTLLILHGGPGLSHQYMKSSLDALLSSSFTLLYYDQRGSGWSEGALDTAKLNMNYFVRDLEEIRRHFKLSKVNLLGHSFGGLLAMYYGITYPERVNSLVLVDPDAASYALRTPYQIKTIDARLSEEQTAYLDSLEETTDFKNYDPSVYESYYKTYLTSYFANPKDTSLLYLGFDTISVPKISITNSVVRANLGAYDIHPQLPKVTCKTLIMQGTESVFSVEGAQAIHAEMPASEIQLFEDCGHFEYLEYPEKFKSMIVNFYGVQ